MTRLVLVVVLAGIVAHAVADEKLAALRAQVALAERKLAETKALANAEFDAWSDKLPEGPNTLEPDGAMDVFSFDTVANDQTPNSANGGKPASLVGNPTIVDGHSGKALLLDGGNGARLADSGRVTRADSLTFALWLWITHEAESAVILHHGNLGSRLLLEKGRVLFVVDDSVKVIAKTPLPTQRWIHIAVSSDGSGRVAGMRIFVDGTLQPTELTPEKPIMPNAGAELLIGSDGLKGGKIDDVRIFPRELAAVEVAALAGRDDFTKALQSIPELTPAQRALLLEYYIATSHDDSRRAREQCKAARDAERSYRIQFIQRARGNPK